MRPYYSIKGSVRSEFTEQRSRFICSCAPVSSAEEAMAFVKRVSQEFVGANHNCYAYVLNPFSSEQKMSDDHEPQGTAGAPILDVIKRKNLTDCVFVVTRYFGGIKLGANGLIGAYSKSAADCVALAEIVKFVYSDVVKVNVDYAGYKKVQETILAYGEITDTTFEHEINIKANIPDEKREELVARLSEISSGRAVLTVENNCYCSYKI